MFGVFEARLAEARWCAGAIHVVLPDPNNGNTDMNIHLKLKRHQHSNLSVKHWYLLQGYLLLLPRPSVEGDVGCRMQNEADRVGTYQIPKRKPISFGFPMLLFIMRFTPATISEKHCNLEPGEAAAFKEYGHMNTGGIFSTTK